MLALDSADAGSRLSQDGPDAGCVRLDRLSKFAPLPWMATELKAAQDLPHQRTSRPFQNRTETSSRGVQESKAASTSAADAVLPDGGSLFVHQKAELYTKGMHATFRA